MEIANEYGETLPDWVEIVNAVDKSKQQLLEMQALKESKELQTSPLQGIYSSFNRSEHQG